MFTTSTLYSNVFRFRAGRAGLPTARVAPLSAAVPQTARGRPPSRRRLICTWILDERTGRLSCEWTLEPPSDGEGSATSVAPPSLPGEDAERRPSAA